MHLNLPVRHTCPFAVGRGSHEPNQPKRPVLVSEHPQQLLLSCLANAQTAASWGEFDLCMDVFHEIHPQEYWYICWGLQHMYEYLNTEHPQRYAPARGFRLPVPKLEHYQWNVLFHLETGFSCLSH